MGNLRHHHASLLIAGGASPVAVAHRLGHKDATETLQTYAHLWATDDDRLVEMSDGLVRVDHHQITTATTTPRRRKGPQPRTPEGAHGWGPRRVVAPL